jgi:hypothetical protein
MEYSGDSGAPKTLRNSRKPSPIVLFDDLRSGRLPGESTGPANCGPEDCVEEIARRRKRGGSIRISDQPAAHSGKLGSRLESCQFKRSGIPGNGSIFIASFLIGTRSARRGVADSIGAALTVRSTAQNIPVPEFGHSDLGVT